MHAQRAMSQYVRDEWTSDRGFPGGPVHAVTQTTDGYLWIGAEKGLVRFDGLTFRLIEPKGTPNAAPAVLGVVAAPDGSVWARLRGIGAASVSARGLREHSDDARIPGIGRHRDGARARQLDPRRHPRPRRDDLAQRTCRRDRGHEGAAGIVVRHLDGCNAERRLLARHARRRRAPRPGHARHAIHGRVAGPESELPARDGRSATCGSAPTRASCDGRERRSAGQAFRAC